MYLEHLPSGKWRAVVQVNGRKRTATSRATGKEGRTEAQLLGAQITLELGGTPTGTTTTVKELLDAHIIEEPFSATYRSDMHRVVNRLPVAFLERPVAKVQPVVIDGLYAQLAREGWTPYRIQRAHGLLGGAFKRAKRWGWITAIPTRDANVPVPASRDDTTPDRVEVQHLLNAAEGDFGLLLWLAVVTGARRGELCGLQWRDIDFRKQLLHIRRAVSYTPQDGVVVGELKTHGKLTRKPVHLGPVTIERLQAYRQTNGGIGEAWVFGGPWRPDTVTHWFGELRATVAADLVKAKRFDDAQRVAACRFHDLRHYNVSDQLNHGADLKTVGENVGQKRAATTSDTYHRVDETLRKNASLGVEERLA
jgi:integrase